MLTEISCAQRTILPPRWWRRRPSGKIRYELKTPYRDGTTCPACGGAMKIAALAHPCARGIRASLHIIACIEDPIVIKKILAHLEETAAANAPMALPPSRAPPRSALFA